MKKILLYTVFGFTLSITEAFAEKYCNSAKTCIWESDGQGNVVVTGTGTLESLQGRSADEPIKTVNINGVSEINNLAFYRLGTLTDVTIGKSVQSIGDSVFLGAFASQKEVYCPKALEDVCRSKIGNFAGTYIKERQYISYYDSTGKFVRKDPNPNYKPKKIYTVEEAMEATKNGDRFHVYLTYK